MFEIPVLLILYKRKDTTSRVLKQLEIIKPKRLFIAADGPKAENDIEKCKETRALFNTISWDCEVKTLFQNKNLGVALGPKTALDWFFEHNEMGIILEDDILPALDFFPFCEELLLRYKDESKVMHISAMNFHYGKKIVQESYYFSRVINPWGWASWRRAWSLYDFDMNDLDEYINTLGLPEYYRHEFYRCKKEHGKFTWDYQWLYSVLKHGGLGIVPSKNLALNIGFDGIDASHTFSTPAWVKKLKLDTLNIKHHPKKLDINEWADELTFKEIIGNYKISTKKRIKHLFS